MALIRRAARRVVPSVGITALLTEAVTSLRRGNEKRALLLAGAALVAVKARTIVYPVYGYVLYRRLQERRQGRQA